MRGRIASSAVVLGLLSALLALPAGAGTASGEPVSASSSNSYLAPTRYTMAMYDWTSMYAFDAAQTSQQLRNLRAEGFRTIFLDVSPVLDLYDLDQPYRDVAVGRFMQRTRTYVRQARSNGITVQALSGAPTWAKPSHRYLSLLLIKFVAAYNRKVAAADELRGIQLDVEFYTQTGFFSNQQQFVLQYLAMLHLVQKELRAQRVLHLPLGAAVPFWLDEQGQHVRSISYGRYRKRPIYHVMDVLSRTSGAYLVVMAYRHSPHGSDGTIRHVRQELAYARKRNLGIVVGQEFSDVKPTKITFYALGKAAFRHAVHDIVKAYGRTRSFRGVSVNDFRAYELASP